MAQIEGIKYFLNQISKGTNRSLSQFIKCLKFSLSEGIPWMNFETIEFLQKIISSDFKIFEFGGGGSTKFFYKRSSFLHTTEHDKDWYEYFTKEIKNEDPTKWKSELHVPTLDTSEQFKSISNPLDYYSDDVNFKQHSFKDYASSISSYPDSYFNLVLVDGRVRPSCIYHSFNKIASGGYLCLDNSEREYYLCDIKNQLLKSFDEVHASFGPVPSTPEFSQATIWRKK
jgi:hypothetical protein